MKLPGWRQEVLLVSEDAEIKEAVASAFGAETELKVVPHSEEAIQFIDTVAVHVLIIDTKTIRDGESVSFLELSQYAAQKNQGLTIILLVNKLLARESDFARKCGAALIMDRMNISIHRMTYVIRVLRKRTFRTLLSRDIDTDAVLPIDVYHYLPMNERFAVFLPAGSPFSRKKRENLHQSGVRHLYVRESDFESAISVLRATHAFQYSEELASIRNYYRQFLMHFFDISTDGMIHFGKELHDQGMEIVARLERLIDRFRDPASCLKELPYPRWSALAHGINCAIYALLFSDHCQFARRREIAFAALVDNIGLSEVGQAILLKKEADMEPEELTQYQKHVQISMDVLRIKQVPFSPFIEEIILHHHENYDGTGFPHGVSGSAFSIEAGLLSLVGSFDYFNTVQPGEKPISALEAWLLLKTHHSQSTRLGCKFHPVLIEELDSFFSLNGF